MKSLKSLADKVGAKVVGDADFLISGVGTLQDSVEGQIAFLDNQKYRRYLADTKASAVILQQKYVCECPTNCLITPFPYITYAKIATEFFPKKAHAPGIHETVVIGNDCQISKTASIGPHAIIGNGVIISENTCVDATCVVGDNCKIGANCHLWPKVTIYPNVVLGDRVVIHSGCVIGADGFGWARGGDVWHKVPQFGIVRIGDDVDIGANTTIDCGALNDTVIENGVKLDNQIQIGHNTRIGSNTVVAGCVGISGSVRIGKNCMIGGGAGIGGHLEIVDNTIIAGRAMVTNSIKKPGVYASGTGLLERRVWQKMVARLRNLDTIARTVRALSKIFSTSK